MSAPSERVATSFGPSALATPANAVTIGRLLISPFLLAMILQTGDSWPALVLWIVLAATDGVDGYIARRMGTTRSGAFLDPLADKVLVLGAMVALVMKGRFWWLSTLSHWDAEEHEVEIQVENGIVRDVQARVRRAQVRTPATR